LDSDELHFVSALRTILANEPNLRLVQNEILNPLLETAENGLHSSEPEIISTLDSEFRNRVKASKGRLSFDLMLLPWQENLLTDLGISPPKVTLEVAVTSMHGFRFARGPDDRAELGDLVIHVDYVSKKIQFGLSNFVQIKLIKDKKARPSIDTKQLRFSICLGEFYYQDWKRGQPMNPFNVERHGPWSHYWFMHSSLEANDILTPVLMANSEGWNLGEWPAPELVFARLGFFSLRPQMRRADDVIAREIRNSHLTSSFLSSENVLSRLRAEGLGDLCSMKVEELPTSKVSLAKNDRPLVPIQPAGVEISNCLFQRHGIRTPFIQSIVDAATGKTIKDSIEKSGLVLIVKVRAGGEEGRNEDEFIPPSSGLS
jgi:hypothetical protein